MYSNSHRLIRNTVFYKTQPPVNHICSCYWTEIIIWVG